MLNYWIMTSEFFSKKKLEIKILMMHEMERYVYDNAMINAILGNMKFCVFVFSSLKYDEINLASDTVYYVQQLKIELRPTQLFVFIQWISEFIDCNAGHQRRLESKLPSDVFCE